MKTVKEGQGKTEEELQKEQEEEQARIDEGNCSSILQKLTNG